MKSKLEMYGLSVCFAAVVCLVISFAELGHSAVEILFPKLTMSSSEYVKYQTNDIFWAQQSNCWFGNKEDRVLVRPSENVLTQLRENRFALAIEGERREGIQSLITCLIFILASICALAIHWRIARKARVA